jgi:hypothetical protein
VYTFFALCSPSYPLSPPPLPSHQIVECIRIKINHIEKFNLENYIQQISLNCM